MELFSVFVANPALIALISGLFFGAYLLLRNTDWAHNRRVNTLLIPATVWLLWAIWEWAVLTFSPEANILPSRVVRAQCTEPCQSSSKSLLRKSD